MTQILYELPTPLKKNAPRARCVTVRLTQHEYELIARIAAHQGVKVAVLMHSYIDLGLRVSAEKLKGQTTK